MKLLLILTISFCLVLTIVLVLQKKRQRKRESQLGIFHHPSNFKKAPLEWVQQPKEESDDYKDTTWSVENKKE